FEKAPNAKTLEEVLTESRIRIVSIVGLATDFCVKATALDAAELRNRGNLEKVIVTRSGVAAVNLKEGDGERAMEEMISAGVEVE
ncbi:MAG: nicotinamidase/pyrazinamidase, partial [Patescibacteria group bacterium]|nr:nicotinamidase/pyrazinamidase [Patescibacteria group bacterium]